MKMKFMMKMKRTVMSRNKQEQIKENLRHSIIAAYFNVCPSDIEYQISRDGKTLFYRLFRSDKLQICRKDEILDLFIGF